MGCVARDMVRAIAPLRLDCVMAKRFDNNCGLDSEGKCKFEHDGGPSSSTGSADEEHEEKESEVAAYYRSLI